MHLLLSLVAPAFKSPRPEHPKFLLSKALCSLPAHSSFTIYFLGHHQARPDLHHPSPSFSSWPFRSRPTRSLCPLHQEALPDYTAPATPPPPKPLYVCVQQGATSAKLSCLPTPIPFCIQLQPQTPGSDERSGEGGDREACSSPLLASLFVRAPALTDPSLALSIALEAPTLAARWVLGVASAPARPAPGAQGAGDISSQLPREQSRGSRAQAVPPCAWRG